MGTERDRPGPSSPEGPSQPWRVGEATLSCSQKYSVTCTVIEEYATCFGVTNEGSEGRWEREVRASGKGHLRWVLRDRSRVGLCPGPRTCPGEETGHGHCPSRSGQGCVPQVSLVCLLWGTPKGRTPGHCRLSQAFAPCHLSAEPHTASLPGLDWVVSGASSAPAASQS